MTTNAEPLEAVERCCFLLACLLALFVLCPLLGLDHAGSAILDVFVSLALLLTVRALRGRGRHGGVFTATLVLALLAITAAVGSHLLGYVPSCPSGTCSASCSSSSPGSRSCGACWSRGR